MPFFTTIVLAGMYGADRVFERPNPIMGAEDFSYVLERVPGCFIQLGARPDDVPAEGAPSNHSAVVRFDDSMLGEQAAALAELAVTTVGEARDRTVLGECRHCGARHAMRAEPSASPLG